MRALRIFGTGLAALILISFASASEERVVYIVSVFTLSPLLLMIAGQLCLPNARRVLTVRLNPELFDGDFGEDIPLRLHGKTITPRYFQRWYEFTVVTHNFILLGCMGLVSLGTTATLWIFHDSVLTYLFPLRLLAMLWIYFVYLAWRWLWERRILQREGISAGPFNVSQVGNGLMKDIRYSFVDNKNQYQGGIVRSLFCDRDSDLTLVFYDERNPERSVPASALIFHRLVWQPDKQ
jgi:hypothetical protein